MPDYVLGEIEVIRLMPGGLNGSRAADVEEDG